ncbi:DNA repair related protein [Cyclospora cayetanensis]|uniref:DNA repair related protein n=1 Tax=Cyclospora cayetanensis TaxID=88456 RepID=A0A1D3D4T6_9EIME|nr:DNA repair related protein [Cyclospora cayetanensis]
MGHAFASLMELLNLKPLRLPVASEKARRSSSVGSSSEEAAALRKCLEVLKKAHASTAAADVPAWQGAAQAGEDVSAAGAVLRAGTGEGSDMRQSSSSFSPFEEEEDASESFSVTLCQLVLGYLYPPSSLFTSRLRPYQAQGVWWMVQCESENAAVSSGEQEALDPLWTVYALPAGGSSSGEFSALANAASLVEEQREDSRGMRACLYLNASAGVVTLQKPSTTGRVKGGILADCMGLGKTVQVLALIAVSLLQERDASERAAVSQPAPRSGDGRRKLERTAAEEGSPLEVSTATGSEKKIRLPPSLLAPDVRRVQRHLKRNRDHLFPGGTLIVVPLSLIGQWECEVSRHLAKGAATVLQYYGSARSKDPTFIAAHSIVLTSYQTLASDFRHLAKMPTFPESARLAPEQIHPNACPLASIRFRRIILDEGHVIRNTNALVNRACNAIKAEARWILTGTPLQNDLSDAFALVEFLRVSPMGSRRWWRANVTQPMEKGMLHGAVETVRRTLVPLMLRRHGDQLGEDDKPLLPLPPLSIHTFKLQLTYEERLYYQTVFEKSKAKFEQLLRSGQVQHHYTHVLQLLLRLRQACNHPLLPTYREDYRHQQLAEAVCRTAEAPSVTSAAINSRSQRFAQVPWSSPDPQLSKCVQDALNGNLGNCPVCFESLGEAAVVLTTCWHVFCLTCVLLVQSSSKTAAAACPTCREKFLPQHVRQLPAATHKAGSLTAWREVVLEKHRASVAAADSRRLDVQLQRRSSEQTVERIPAAACTTSDETSQRAPLLPLLENASEEAFFFSTKMRVLLALLEADVLAGRFCVVFSQWTSMLDLIEDAFQRAEAAALGRGTLPSAKSGSAREASPSKTVSLQQRQRQQREFDQQEEAQRRGDTPEVVSIQEEDAAAEEAASQGVSKSDAPEEAQGVLLVEKENEYVQVDEDDTDADEVIEIGMCLAGGNRMAAPPQAKRPADSSKRPLFDYRRVDGTLSLDARQRVIRWFLEPLPRQATDSAGKAAAGVSPAAEEANEDPFMGVCKLQPFSCSTSNASLGTSSASSFCSREHAGDNRDSGTTGKILLLSLKTGNVGLNLTKATRCYLVDGWWNPQVESQAMRRLWRYGQEKAVSVFRFVCLRTVEERMEELLKWKGRLSENTLRPDEASDSEAKLSWTPGEGDEDAKRKGRLSILDLKRLFEGWEEPVGKAP